MASQCVTRDGKVVVKQMDLTLKAGQFLEVGDQRWKVVGEPTAKKVAGETRMQWMQVYTVEAAGGVIAGKSIGLDSPVKG